MNNTQLQWFAVEITVDSRASEAVESALNALDALGTEINNLGRQMPETLNVIGYFNELPNETDLDSTLSEYFKIYGCTEQSLKNIERREVENQDWLAEWKKHWRPTESTKFIIAPTWETVENPDKIVIRIEPSMAFGTGTHETTRLCLKAIEENYRTGESFFDVGTGTGILSIAVAKLQKAEKARISACDTDEDSIKIALENAALNQTPEIEFFVGSITPDSPEFDFVCANVTLDVIAPLLPLLLEKSKRLLVLSGILTEQEPAIRTELEKFGFDAPEVENLGEWISVKVKTEN